MYNAKFRTLTVLSLGACLLAGGLLHGASAGPTQKPGQGMTGPGGGPGGQGGRGMRFLQRMGDELNLTAAQKAKLQPIAKASREKMMALRDDQTLTEDQRRAKFKAIRDERNKKIAAILTPAQKKKFAEITAKMAQRGPGGWGGRPGGGQGGNRGGAGT